MTDQPTTPVEAFLRAGELYELMNRLAAMDLHPVEYAADIETDRAKAEDIARDVLGYLLASANFVPVVEAPDAVQEWDL